MVSFWEAYSGKRFFCCIFIVLYSIYSMVGWCIAFISDLGSIFTSALRASVNMSPQVWYISYRTPYRTIYITKKKPKLQFQYNKYSSKSYCEHFMCIDNILMSGLKCSLTYVLACSTLTNLLSWKWFGEPGQFKNWNWNVTYSFRVANQSYKICHQLFAYMMQVLHAMQAHCEFQWCSTTLEGPARTLSTRSLQSAFVHACNCV